MPFPLLSSSLLPSPLLSSPLPFSPPLPSVGPTKFLPAPRFIQKHWKDLKIVVDDGRERQEVPILIISDLEERLRDQPALLETLFWTDKATLQFFRDGGHDRPGRR